MFTSLFGAMRPDPSTGASLRVCVALFAIAVSACGDRVLEVRVLPTRYEVGSIRSELATPAVDEAVRQNPSKIHIWACTFTPPAKVAQFRDELVARHNIPITLAFLKEGCA